MPAAEAKSLSLGIRDEAIRDYFIATVTAYECRVLVASQGSMDPFAVQGDRSAEALIAFNHSVAFVDFEACEVRATLQLNTPALAVLPERPGRCVYIVEDGAVIRASLDGLVDWEWSSPDRIVDAEGMNGRVEVELEDGSTIELDGATGREVPPRPPRTD